MADISIILPCYNVASVVDRCLSSIVMQTLSLEHFEIICVNDASTDETIDVLKAWEKRYPENIIIIDCEENRKVGHARNLGLQYATSKWIAFIDSDDWIEKDYFEKMLVLGEENSADVVVCQAGRDKSKDLEYYDADDRLSGTVEVYEIEDIDKRKLFFHIQPLKLYAWAKLINRDILINNSIVFPENYTYEDIMWGNLLHMYANKAVVLDEKLYHYFVNPGSIVLKKNEYYHIDHLTVQEMMWTDWIARGFFDEYKYELEYEYIINGYLAFLKILTYRYDESQYSLFQLLQTLTVTKISYEDNPYLKGNHISDFYKILVEASRMRLSRKDYEELTDKIKKIGL